MTVKVPKHRHSIRDHLTAYLVVVVIIAVIVVGAATLFMTGIFNPVEIGVPLEGTVPIPIETPAPRAGLLDWLFPVAHAAEDAATDDLEKLLQEIVEEEGTDDEEIPEEDRITVQKNDLSLNTNLPDNVYNVLLLGTDSRDMHRNPGRSDVMIIASINMKANEIKLSSISRDLYVKIPGASENKINAAHAYGGPNLAMKTVNEVFELNIQDYALVNFATMSSIIDALGGVDIYLIPKEYEHINYNVAVSEDYEGFAKSSTRRALTEADQDTIVHLDGLQGVAYARIRKMDSDIQRGSRQRILLQALMDKAMSNLSFATFTNLATSMLNSVSTEIKLTTVLELGSWVLSSDGSLSMQELSIPIAGSFRGTTEKDMSVLTFNQKANVEALHAFIYGEYIPAEPAK